MATRFSSCLLAGVVGVTACSKDDVAGSKATTNKPTPNETVAQRACKHAPGWRYERIKLPPPFAPTMAKGEEELFFAPGMFKPQAPTYFSYVFSLSFEQAHKWDAKTLRAVLNTYYRGLMTAVAKGNKVPLDPAKIDTKVSRTKSGFVASVSLVDAFTTNKPITLTMTLAVKASCIRAAASPRKRGDPVWKQLDAALKCVPCP